MKSRHTGFTLIELVITIAILGILLAWAIPNISVFIKNARISSVTTELMGDINLARQEAQRRGRPVTICATSDGLNCLGSTPDWMNGWIIQIPGAPTPVAKWVQEPDGPSTTRKVNAFGAASIVFSPSGSVVGAGTTGLTINVRDDRAGTGDLTQRDISVTLVGRPLMLKVVG